MVWVWSIETPDFYPPPNEQVDLDDSILHFHLYEPDKLFESSWPLPNEVSYEKNPYYFPWK